MAERKIMLMKNGHVLLEKGEYMRLRFIDDAFFKSSLELHPEVASEIVSILLGKPVPPLKAVPQKDIATLGGKEVVLDCYLKDEEGNVYDLEFQIRPTLDLYERSIGYFAKLVDAMMVRGKDYSTIRSVRVFFLCGFDLEKEGKPVYEVLKGSSGSCPDKVFAVKFLNSSYRGEDPLGRLYSDLLQSDYNLIGNPVLKEAMWDLKSKELERRKESMCYITERAYNYGAEDTKIENAKNLILMGKITLQDISKAIGLPLEKVEELAESLKKAKA